MECPRDIGGDCRICNLATMPARVPHDLADRVQRHRRGEDRGVDLRQCLLDRSTPDDLGGQLLARDVRQKPVGFPGRRDVAVEPVPSFGELPLGLGLGGVRRRNLGVLVVHGGGDMRLEITVQVTLDRRLVVRPHRVGHGEAESRADVVDASDDSLEELVRATRDHWSGRGRRGLQTVVLRPQGGALVLGGRELGLRLTELPLQVRVALLQVGDLELEVIPLALDVIERLLGQRPPHRVDLEVAREEGGHQRDERLVLLAVEQLAVADTVRPPENLLVGQPVEGVLHLCLRRGELGVARRGCGGRTRLQHEGGGFRVVAGGEQRLQHDPEVVDGPRLKRVLQPVVERGPHRGRHEVQHLLDQLDSTEGFVVAQLLLGVRSVRTDARKDGGAVEVSHWSVLTTRGFLMELPGKKTAPTGRLSADEIGRSVSSYIASA